MKVLTFSTKYPSYHPRKGEPTFFVEKVLKSIGGAGIDTPDNLEFDLGMYHIVDGKHHTIRAGHRFKVGEFFSPRVWSGKPYASKQITFARPIEVKKVWNLGLRIRGDFKEFYSIDSDLTMTSIKELSDNDGLTINDLFSWFNKPFEGQIICWNENINY